MFSIVAAALLPLESGANDQDVDLERIGRDLEELEAQATLLDNQASLLMEQYGRDVDVSVGEFERRFSEAEIHFLLEDYSAAIVYLYDIVDSPRFREMERYDDALFYLAESLYKQESWLPARGFFLKLVERRPARHYEDALIRLLEISGRIGDYSDVERHYQSLVASGRPVRPEIRYVWGKFIFARRDLEDSVRWERSREAFEKVPIDGPYGLAARYFSGVVFVQEARKTWERAREAHQASPEGLERAEKRFHEGLRHAAAAFVDVVRHPATDRRGRAVQEQAWLALGRVYVEMGQEEAAIDAYQRIHRHSEHYFQSLYEVAWAFVGSGDMDNARRAAEILLTGAGDSVLAPEVRLLLGHLHARAQRYERAVAAYDEVIREFSPVRDELDELLESHDDPVAYFSGLIAEADGGFDVDTLLPTAAARWASTQQEVERGFAIVSDLEDGRAGIEEGREIAQRVLASLDGGTLEPFPVLSEGHQRANETRARLLDLQSRLSGVEHALLSHRVPPSLQAAYDEARQERQRLEAEHGRLPSTPEEMEARRQRWLATVERVHREAFRARLEAQSQAAQIEAMQALLEARSQEALVEPSVLDAFVARVEREKAEVERLEARANMLMRELDGLASMVRADTTVAGAREASAAYEQALADESALFGRVREELGAADEKLQRLDAVRNDTLAASEKVARLLDDIETRGAARREVLRDRVMNELDRLEEYAGEAAYSEVHTRDLIGRIAYDSVGAVRRQFYDLVLRSDVGIIDVAWARKSDRSREIQKLVEEKDLQLRALERDFREVMHDPDAGARR